MRFFSVILLCCLTVRRDCTYFAVQAFAPVYTTPNRFIKPFTSFNRLISLRALADNTDDEIERLRSMAAKLRAEAATLEVRIEDTEFVYGQSLFNLILNIICMLMLN